MRTTSRKMSSFDKKTHSLIIKFLISGANNFYTISCDITMSLREILVSTTNVLHYKSNKAFSFQVLLISCEYFHIYLERSANLSMNPIAYLLFQHSHSTWNITMRLVLSLCQLFVFVSRFSWYWWLTYVPISWDNPLQTVFAINSKFVVLYGMPHPLVGTTYCVCRSISPSVYSNTSFFSILEKLRTTDTQNPIPLSQSVPRNMAKK